MECVFHVWNHHCRFFEDGKKIYPKKRESLVVSRVEHHYHNGKNLGRIFYDDGTFTKEFPIDYENPSNLAITATNFEKWYKATNRQRA